MRKVILQKRQNKKTCSINKNFIKYEKKLLHFNFQYVKFKNVTGYDKGGR